VYFFLWQRAEKLSIGNRFFVHQRLVSAIKRVEFVSARMSYIVLRGRWCNIIVLQIEKTEMGGACGTYGGGERCILDFGGVTRGKATTWETQA
jgi:hypothetical protein